MSIKKTLIGINLGKEDINMLANRKIVIIGAGHVGSHCAYALAIQGICDEIVLVDKDRTKAKSHSMEIIAIVRMQIL